ncbi:hypothetical protein [Polynucleobacter yangtzensis]|uniref:hypothetical protein n=1 Tax=Polynucleobacter yangtzensis TaxID=1743159 RepID=UPI0008365A3A|nr:hypothetical protein [Polynucleobacter yangtzensis]
MSMLKGMRGNGIFLFALALQGGSVALAQDGVASTASAFAVSQPLQYKSVFEGYQPYSEEEVISWKQANATVEKIGGWKAYAKEASQSDQLPANEGHSKSHHEGVK